ncbi:hypothetical protein GH714_000030 [Hevea brasiliensis]|uniref:ABC transporter domain-containing protein n=1 Tax=Hevea brasiliensis TaxID=3981 RepID=A0A6A6N9H2_HEVBR|nr:hypothetical protein GH714_000030 [Hevea brasiliensis]
MTEMKKEDLDDGGVYISALFFTLITIMFNGMAELSMTIVKLPLVFGCSSTYYVIGFDPDVGRLFKQYLLLILVPTNSNSIESLRVQILKNGEYFAHAYWYWLGVGASAGYIFLFNFLYTVALTFLDPFDKPQAVISDELEESNNTKGAIQLSQLESSHRNNIESETSENNESSHNKKKGMVLLFEPHSITFDNVIYSVDMPQGVSGAFRPGVLTALMGVSGADKTTLMDVLAGRKTGGYIEGNITISGYPKKQETFARISGYCEHNNIHSPRVTVYESLVYSAWLRLPPEVDSETRKMFVDEVKELVELNPLRQAPVGLAGDNGLSTEQCKRLTIAVELVANPSIIFMDEPTSGLNASAAAIVMRTVRNTVDTRSTVVCTIRQPSIDIFEAFDEAIEGVSKIIDGYNQSSKSDVGSYQRNKAMIQELSKPAPGTKELYFPAQYSQPFLTQCMACLWKHSWSYWRNPPYTAVRFWFTTFIALMFGTIFWDLVSRREKEGDLSNALGSMYAAVLFLGLQNATSVQLVVTVERTVFYREKAARMYFAMPYAYAQAGVYSVITYLMIGFEWTAAKFFWYLFFLYFTLLYFTYYGMMTVAVTPNHHIASIVSSAFYSVWNLFSGFIIPRTVKFADVKTRLETTGQTVEEYVNDYYGIKHDFLGVAAGIVVGITLLFAFAFAISIKAFNFQKR